MVLFACVTLIFYNGEYKRLHCELSDPLLSQRQGQSSAKTGINPSGAIRKVSALTDGGGEAEGFVADNMESDLARVGSLDNSEFHSVGRGSSAWSSSISSSHPASIANKYVSAS